jgi:hypothetical protein
VYEEIRLSLASIPRHASLEIQIDSIRDFFLIALKRGNCEIDNDIFFKRESCSLNARTSEKVTIHYFLWIFPCGRSTQSLHEIDLPNKEQLVESWSPVLLNGRKESESAFLQIVRQSMKSITGDMKNSFDFAVKALRAQIEQQRMRSTDEIQNKMAYYNAASSLIQDLTDSKERWEQSLTKLEV